MKNIRHTVRFRLAGVALTALTLSACGSTGNDSATPEVPSIEKDNPSDSTNNDTTTTPGDDTAKKEVDPEKAQIEYDQCMKDNGISVASPGQDGTPVQAGEVELGDSGPSTQEEFEEAIKKCEAILNDAFGEFDLDPEQKAELDDQMLELQRCLADLGHDINIEGNGFELGDGEDIEEFEKAMKTCQPDTIFDQEVGK